jgi:hypothetical protein
MKKTAGRSGRRRQSSRTKMKAVVAAAELREDEGGGGSDRGEGTDKILKRQMSVRDEEQKMI